MWIEIEINSNYYKIWEEKVKCSSYNKELIFLTMDKVINSILVALKKFTYTKFNSIGNSKAIKNNSLSFLLVRIMDKTLFVENLNL